MTLDPDQALPGKLAVLAFLDSVTIGPEYLLEASPGGDEGSAFEGPTFWVRAVHTIEPGLKRAKDRFLSLAGA